MFLHLCVILFTGGSPRQRPPSLDRNSPDRDPLDRDPPGQRPPPPRDPPMAKSRWNASYWNAFLCSRTVPHPHPSQTKQDCTYSADLCFLVILWQLSVPSAAVAGGWGCLPRGESAQGVYTSPLNMDRILDTRLWKHYLSATLQAVTGMHSNRMHTTHLLTKGGFLHSTPFMDPLYATPSFTDRQTNRQTPLKTLPSRNIFCIETLKSRLFPMKTTDGLLWIP